MTVYELYLESGPKHRKTMVHVPQLLGCVSVGPSTAEALEVAPVAIEAFLRFLKRHGDQVVPAQPFETRIAEHITEGEWLGNGSPYLTFATDLEPLSDREIDRALARLKWVCEELGTWARSQSDDQLQQASPQGGRPAGAILLHVLGPQGSYLASAFGGAPGFGPIYRRVEQGETSIVQALLESWELCVQRVQEATPEQRRGVRQGSKYVYTLHKALRRMNEHGWEHLVELSRRPGGPVL